MPKLKGVQTEMPIEAETSNEGHIIHDVANGEVTLPLQNGIAVTFKEPKASDFLRLTSALETAPIEMKGDTMTSFRLAHLMIDRCSPVLKGVPRPNPDFDTFLDWLGDDDIMGVATVLKCFPDIGERLKRATDKDRVAASVKTI